MKRLFILFAAAIMTVGVMAQETTQTAPIGNAGAHLYCIDNTYYYAGQTIEKDQILNFYAQQNCQAAYDQFVNGQKLATAGWVLLGVGGALDIGAAICYSSMLAQRYSPSSGSSKMPGKRLANSSDYSLDDPAYVAMVMLGIGGAACEIACIPCLVVGYHKMHSSADIYNALHSTAQVQPYWAIQASTNGLGLALHF
jgi:hypothetical protein